jgi:hypothetical protein
MSLLTTLLGSNVSSGGGSIITPATTTQNALVVWDDTTGTALANSDITYTTEMGAGFLDISANGIFNIIPPNFQFNILGEVDGDQVQFAIINNSTDPSSNVSIPIYVASVNSTKLRHVQSGGVEYISGIWGTADGGDNNFHLSNTLVSNVFSANDAFILSATTLTLNVDLSFTNGNYIFLDDAVTGAQASGSASLSAGTVNITTSAATGSYQVIITPTNVGTLTGILTVQKNNGNFVVTSSVGGDNVTFDWLIIKRT